ncbi:MAG: 3-deoxy-D-manno-octulosonic acid transferase [Thermodesulfobacteriota bacterium]
MIHTFYDIVLHLAFILLIPYFIFRSISLGKYRSGTAERFGFIAPERLEALAGGGGRVVWFHAVSVGETKAVLPLVRLLKERHPELKVVFSTVTPTGNSVAEKEGEGLIDSLLYFPVDFSWVVRSVVRRINPAAFVVVEKEVWPNFVRALKERAVPIVVVNGTVSERSFRGYRRFHFLFKDAFASISRFCARTDEDGRRALELGVPPERMVVAGNIKFDMEAKGLGPADAAELKSSLGLRPDDRVVVAGSTHAGEEEIVLRAFKELREEFQGLKLVLAPRHPERFDEVESIVRGTGLAFSRRSAGGGERAGSGRPDVIILDTMGELGRVYGISTVAFVGGTLVEIGGHNLLEPALFGKPVVYGPHVNVYLQMAEMLERAGGVGASKRVSDGEGLKEALREILKDGALREKMGKAAAEAVEANRGATEKVFHIIEGFLEV